MNTNLGPSNNFSIFVINDHIQQNGECQGRIAVGNLAEYKNFLIGSNVEKSTQQNNLIVGKEINIKDGINFSGNSIIQFGGKVINYTMSNENNVTNQPLSGQYINFAVAENYLKRASSYWSTLTGFNKILFERPKVTVINNNQSITAFTLQAEDLEKYNEIRIISKGKYPIVINILDKEITMKKINLLINDIEPTKSSLSRVIWNLPNAKNLILQKTRLQGTVLAPKATVLSISSKIIGQIVANNLIGDINIDKLIFKGNLPECPY